MWKPVILVLATALLLAACSSQGPAPDGAEAGVSEPEYGPGWFGGYQDVTLPTGPLLAEPRHEPGTTVLSFISSDPSRPCEPSWGGTYSLQLANDKLRLDARINNIRKAGGGIGVSFGGQRGTELAVACPDADALVRAYTAVMDRYRPDVLDLDVEGSGAADTAAAERRAAAVARLQAVPPSGASPKVWLTLPVSRHGLTPAAELSVKTMLDAGVDVAGVNLMTMNFGPLSAGQSMLNASVAAAEAAHQALTALLRGAGLEAGEAGVWNRIGLTPMIGVNDVEDNVFTPLDAEGLNAFAVERGVGRMSMWSLNRDVACPKDDLQQQSGAPHSCSGVEQEPGAFAKALGKAVTGRP